MFGKDSNARRASIAKLREKGMTMQEIGDLLGLSRQRISQIVGEGSSSSTEMPEVPATDPVVESIPDSLPSQTKVAKARSESRMNANRKMVGALRQSGLTYNEIAEKLSISAGYAQVLNGSDGRRGGSKIGTISDSERLDRDIRWYRSRELSAREIGVIVDVPTSTVTYRLNKMGLYHQATENDKLFEEGKRRCSACHEVKELKDFRSHPKGKGHRLLTCKLCSAEGWRRWKNKQSNSDQE